MKRSKLIQLLLVAISVVALAFVTSCEGPMGPAGPAGADGADGTNGTDGTDGVAGNLSCLACHTQEGMDALQVLYDLSGHASASTVAYAGGRASCARCHSSEGFANYLTSAPGVAAVDIAYPSKIRCSTCHSNHSSLEDGISAPMVTTASVIGISDGTEFDFGNTSNLCGNCHQARRDGASYDTYATAQTFTRKFSSATDIATYTTAAFGPAGSSTLVVAGTAGSVADTLTVVFDVPTTHVYISSTHAGPHHGPQLNTLFGNGGYGTSSTHAHTDAGCVTCHMGTAGTTSGGHSFYANVENCVTCHASATDFDINGKQTDFDTRMAAIGAALEAKHAIHIDATTGEVHPLYASIPRADFEAFWNYMVLYEDFSHGVHNPSYFATLLAGAEAKLGL